MKASTKRVLSLLGTALLFVGALAFYSLFLLPAYTATNEMRGELAARSQLFEDQKRIVSRVSDLIAQYQGTANVQNTVSLTLPRDAATASMVAQLNGIAGASGIIIQSLSLQKQALRPSPGGNGEAAKPIGTVEANVRILGSYESFKNFLAGVETNIRLMDIKNWRIETPPKNVAGGTINYTVVVDAYYQAE